MTARFTSLSTRAQVALVSGALLLVLIIGYFALISPKRATAADLKQQTAAVQQQIQRNSSAGFTQALPAVRSASVFSLAKAMPTQVEMPDVILQLNQLAQESGITFQQISPGSSSSTTSTVPTVTGTSSDPFAAEPVQVAFTGSFYDLVAFLMRVRNLVRIENGHLDAAGRLFDVSDIDFCVNSSGAGGSGCGSTTLPAGGAGSPKVPIVTATLTVNAFVPQAPQPTSTTPGSTGTTSTTTTSTTTTTSNSTSASQSTSGGNS